MQKETAVAVVGCGFFAQNHLNAWRDLKAAGVEIAAVCDIDPAKAKAAAEKFGVRRWYSDAATMLSTESLDLVDIVTAMDTHRDLVEKTIGSGVATIVQKPFGPRLEDCTAMASHAKRAGVFLAIHENFRFQMPMRRAVEVVRSGDIGIPSWARISFRIGYDLYKDQPYLTKEERFALIDAGIHVLDLARVFLGEVEHLSAELQRRNPRVRGEDTATMMMRHSSGAVSVVEVTYESRRLPDPFPETLIEVEGPKGAVALRAGAIMEVSTSAGMASVSVDPPVPSWGARPWHIVQESVLATCTHMLEAFRAGRPAATSAEDNVKTFALAEAAYVAAATGKAVRPSDLIAREGA